MLIRTLWGALIAVTLMASSVLADTLNVSIDTSAVAGSPLKAVFDVTANTPFLNEVDILNFSAPGSTMGLTETTGGLVDGDLILLSNPAPFTFIDTGAFFNELIVNLTPVSNTVTFGLSYTTNAPVPGTPPDQIAFFLLDSSYLPLFPTSDPLGADALFSIDLNGTSSSPNIYSPAIQSSPGNVQITVPGTTPVPEPTTLLLTLSGVAIIAFKIYPTRRGQE